MLTDERIIELWRDHGGVMGSAQAFARAVEREARQQALEEAAAVCSGYGNELDSQWNRDLGVATLLSETCEDCAAAIRALIDQDDTSPTPDRQHNPAARK